MTDVVELPVLLSRPWQLVNCRRDYEIFLDGEWVGALRNGETVAVHVPLGAHELVARIDWCTSTPLRFELFPDSEACFQVACRVRWWHLLFGGFAVLWYLVLHRRRYLSLEAV